MIIKEDELGHYLGELNSIYTRIKFSYELEANRKIIFLDITLIRTNNKKQLHQVLL